LAQREIHKIFARVCFFSQDRSIYAPKIIATVVFKENDIFSEKWSTSQEVILGNWMHVLITCWSDFKKDLGLRKSMQQSVV
jgi:hypothetical protein